MNGGGASVAVVGDDGFKFKENIRVIANAKTNTLYLITFESTPQKWDSEWNTHGKPVSKIPSSPFISSFEMK
jgi:hypothetical protein